MKYFFSILSMLLLQAALAQTIVAPVLTHITDANGLSDNTITCVLKDKAGLVWIGTAEGLNLMDGSSLMVYKHLQNDSTSIPANAINCLTQDGYGNVWIGTASGFCAYNPMANNFTNYTTTASPFGGSENVNQIVPDANGLLWLGTNGGLYCFDIATKKIKHFLHVFPNNDAVSIKANKIFGLQAYNNQLLICSYYGLWIFEKNTHQFLQAIKWANNILDEFYTCTTITNDGRVWVGSWSNGLLEYLPASRQIISHQARGGGSNIVGIKPIYDVDGNYQLLLNGELQLYNPTTQKFGTLGQPLQMNETPTVVPMFASNDGWQWLGSRNGLYILDPTRQQFLHHVFKVSLTTQTVFFFENNQQLWVCAQGSSFLSAYNSQLVATHNYSGLRLLNRQVLHPEFTNNLSVAKDSNSIWFGTSDGLCHFNMATKKTAWFVHQHLDTNSLPRNFIAHVFVDKKKQLWVFPWREGVWKLNKEQGNFKRICKGSLKESGGLKGMVISDAKEDKEDNIWMADLDEGILCYNPLNNLLTKPFEKEFGSRCHAGKLEEKNNWLHTIINRTIVKWNPATMQTIRQNLPPEMDKEVYDFTLDKQGNWWLATHAGLVVWNEENHVFKKFTIADGLLSNDLNGTLFCRQNGSIVLGTPNYISTFNPITLLAHAKQDCQLLNRGLYVNGQWFATPFNTTIKLGYQSNNLSFKWAIADYTNPFANQYFYRLTATDTAWHSIGNKGEVQFASLSAGNYLLQLTATASNGAKSKMPLSIRFIIRPPFWKTWWFWAILFASICAAVVYFFWKRIKTIRKQEALKQLMTAAEMKALRAQMNPHFIFNSLNSIQECIVMKNTEAAYSYLSKFSKLVRRILENSGKALVSLQEEMELLEWYVELEVLRFNDKVDVTFSYQNVDASLLLPSMILQPYIENALWHGLATKQGYKQLSVSMAIHQDRVITTIEDNGIGRQQAQQLKQHYKPSKQSLGLSITQERLALFSEKAQVEIEDLMDNNANPTGTRVTVKLPLLLG